MDTRSPRSLDVPTATTTAQRILAEGALPLLAAAQDAGLLGEALPSKKTLLRAAISRKLEAVKVAGRWLTSSAGILRWVAAAQHRQARCGIDAVAANQVLASYGLGRKVGQ
jgi:hypothetical protein